MRLGKRRVFSGFIGRYTDRDMYCRVVEKREGGWRMAGSMIMPRSPTDD